ncbi:sulfate ABC transporter substrate-binding protein [Laspinema sp. A4]|uniref:sulfate ABC transporter substrate-binding protein n=1 Tax=Laspinema sp. D2d TaxID=2953686 RepID=UPI0021BAE698|nr:sulfate ABC transporter substrate-binding protein [Laspinema sp. D2d]MCT7983594.1 sulfate ABC transporter substrate-binding protein [Laspinema sp. D2d]
MSRFWSTKFLIRWGVVFFAGVSLSWAIAACTGNPSNTNPLELTLVSYMVTPSAYQEIIPQFLDTWNREHDRKAVIRQSYGPSGTQTRTVLHGLDADVVALALALDIQQLEKVGLIEPGWEQEAPNNSIVTRSVVTIATRPNNPKGIQTWADLAKDDVKVVLANPKTSGGARWSFLALWGSVTQTGGTPEEARAFTQKVYENAVVLSKDSREATDAFVGQDQGDVLVNYENEMILAGLNDRQLPYIVPEVNIGIENAVAIIDENVEKHGNRELAEAFLRYLFTPEAQTVFARYGFRPIDPNVESKQGDRFPVVDTSFTIEDLGGWDTVQKQFFDAGAIFDEIQANLYRP